MNETEKPERDKNVYGENHPGEEDASTEEGIREKVADRDKSTAEDLDETRRKQVEKGGTSGGMGRAGTPSSDAPQGGWGDHEGE